jgi:hypothetical protein
MSEQKTIDLNQGWNFILKGIMKLINYREFNSCINYTGHDNVRSKDIYLFFNININNCF